MMRALIAMGTAWLLVACGHGQLAAVQGGAIDLKPDEGLLLVHTRMGFRFDRLDIGDGWLQGPPEGSHVELFIVPEGDYRWTAFRMGPIGFRAGGDPAFDFHVEAGKINYPGELVVVSGGWNRARIFTRNRSAMVLESLKRRYPGVHRRYPLAYTGFLRDDFYEFYRGLDPDPGGDGSDWKEKLDAL